MDSVIIWKIIVAFLHVVLGHDDNKVNRKEWVLIKDMYRKK